jgi:S1-C subfamily serine protease
LGDSSRIAPGDRVVGIGNAGGKGGVPSRAPGTVTALDQTVIAADALDSRSERLTGLIEITAPLRPGDSGGPLVDSAGQVIGIDTAAAANNRADGRTGQGYAIPIDQALQIAQRFLGRG